MRPKTRRKRKEKPVSKGRMDYLLLGLAVVLTMLGVLMVYDASVVEAYRDFQDKFYFARQQLIWAAAGIMLMLVLSRIPIAVLRKIAVWAFGATVLLLVAVLIPSLSTKVLGARRWLTLGGVNLQPAEFTKLTLTMYLASLFEKHLRFKQFAFVTLGVFGLIMLEPDLGTAVVIATVALSIYFFSGGKLTHLALTVVAGALGAAGLIAGSEYRRARIMTFLDPTSDPLGASYHIRQVLIALGSGGAFGVGLGRSRQKYEYIPAATTDSIFAIIAEEIGFLGALVLIALFVLFMFRSFNVARSVKDRFASLAAGGIATWIGIQVVINLGTMVALVPITGVPLPFISYGGSSTIAVLSGVGILLSISRHESQTR